MSIFQFFGPAAAAGHFSPHLRRCLGVVAGRVLAGLRLPQVDISGKKTEKKGIMCEKFDTLLQNRPAAAAGRKNWRIGDDTRKE